MNAIMRMLFGDIPSGLVFLCSAVTFFVPYTIYRVNRVIHRHGDPAWKKQRQ